MSEKKEALRKPEDEKKKILDLSEVSLTLDTYDDIFSDFDPRVYSQRALSYDLLGELKRATREREGKMQLKFIIPREIRNWENEDLIKNRLRSHFKRHYLILLDETNKIKRKGITMAVLGAAMISAAAYISFLKLTSFMWHLLIIILEPAGWFTAWTGLDEIYYTAKQKKEELDFYEKMSNSDIEFVSY